jgi:acetylornithine deacetylase/succinyl-diaminopimelate desuccinylase-like protein
MNKPSNASIAAATFPGTMRAAARGYGSSLGRRRASERCTFGGGFEDAAVRAHVEHHVGHDGGARKALWVAQQDVGERAVRDQEPRPVGPYEGAVQTPPVRALRPPASKGALHVELVARGKMAHSAYPELGESAIDKLVEALHRLHAMKLPEGAEVGPCTKNVGSIQGGRAPNVISDYARADLFYRLVGPAEGLRREITEAVGELAEVRFTRETPFLRLRTLDGLPTMVAAFTTDIPSLTNWGEPLLLGPGSIHVAHTEGEFVEKKQLAEAVELYCAVARKLSPGSKTPLEVRLEP